MQTLTKQPLFKVQDLIPGVLYKLSSSFHYHDGKKFSEFTSEEMFLFGDDGLLHALEDGVLINPAVLRKAKINLLPPSEWRTHE